MLFAGFATFSLLYATQPLLPTFARAFDLSAGGASLAVSIATGPLAIGTLVADAMSDRWGRRPMMVVATFCLVLGGVALAGAVALARVAPLPVAALEGKPKRAETGPSRAHGVQS